MGTTALNLFGVVLRDLLVFALFLCLFVVVLFSSVRSTSAASPQETGVEVTSPPPNGPRGVTELELLTIIGSASSPYVPLDRNLPLRI